MEKRKINVNGPPFECVDKLVNRALSKTVSLTSDNDHLKASTTKIPSSMGQTSVMKYSIPKMDIMIATTNILDADNFPHSDEIETLKTSPNRSSHFKLSGKSDYQIKRSKIMDKLASSPYLSQSLSSSSFQNIKTKKADAETDWKIKQKATSVLTEKGNSTASKLMLQERVVTTKSESQGPIDWDLQGLWRKYRSEHERECLWLSYVKTQEYAESVAYENEEVIQVPAVERHPLVNLYEALLEKENILSRQRTSARLKMKRFVLDVHEIWLTNLQHLREHFPNRAFKNKGSHEGSGRTGSSSGYSDSEDEITRQSERRLRGNGLRDRRDYKSIEMLTSQIQSVSQNRASKNSFCTTRMPDPTAKLDYVARPGPPKPYDTVAIPNGPLLQSLIVTNYYRTVGNIPLVICIDRLIPRGGSLSSQVPQSSISGITSYPSWRILLIRLNEDLVMRSYVFHETEVTSFFSAAGDYFERIQMLQSINEPKSRLKLLTRDITLVWGLKAELNAQLTVNIVEIESNFSMLSVSSFVHPENNFRVELVVTFLPPYNSTVAITYDPIEFLSVLGVEEIPTLDISIRQWLKNSVEPNNMTEDENSYIWERLFRLLFVEDGDEDSNGDPIPLRISVKHYYESYSSSTAFLESSPRRTASPKIRDQQKTVISQLLESSKAINYAHLLCSMFSISDNLELSLCSQASKISKLEFRSHSDPFTFEEEAEYIPSLSMRVSGGVSNLRLVPGASPIGSVGVWFNYSLDKERTSIAANFFRNPQISSTDSIFVNLTLALDTPVLFPLKLAWEIEYLGPMKSPHCPVEGSIVSIIPKPLTLFTNPVKSLLESRLCPRILIFNTAPYEGLDFPLLRTYRNGVALPPKGFTRHYYERDNDGFRNYLIEDLLDVDPLLPTIVFGVTKQGALPNNVAVHTRSVWHSETLITEFLSRPRGAKDYHYVLRNLHSHGSNDPSCFFIRFLGYGNKDIFQAEVISSAFIKYEMLYKEIGEQRKQFNRETALESKIENSEVFLRARQKRYEDELRKQTQRAIEKKMRKATKSERGWRQRMDYSIRIAVQGDWEQRLDQRVGMCFFHRLSCLEESEEKLNETCQWEVPSSWSGNPVEGIDSLDSDCTSSSTCTEAPFSQPNELWLPFQVNGLSSVHQQKTPGIATSPTRIHRQSKSKAKYNKIDAESVEQNRNDNLGIVEDFLLNDEIIYALARRLGIAADNITPATELSSVFTSTESPLLAPRNECNFSKKDVENVYFDSDDDLWSDDEKLVGDFSDDNIGPFLPQCHADVLKQSIEQKKLLGNTSTYSNTRTANGQSQNKDYVPYLNFSENKNLVVDEAHAGNKTVVAWRKLPRPEIPANFFKRCTQTRTIGPDINSSANKVNNPVFLVPLSPVDACKYEPPTFSTTIESIYIPNARKDMERVMATVERNIAREEELSRNLPTDELLLFGKPTEMTSIDNFIAKQYHQDREIYKDPHQEAVEKAIQAAKSSNISQMEDALEENIQIDTIDQFGNTLLLLAAQQGSKRMVKLLLRRGAYVNAQNVSGNTALHYCYTYGHTELAEYLKKMGADDSILNARKLTCYEGLTIDEEGDGDEDS